MLMMGPVTFVIRERIPPLITFFGSSALQEVRRVACPRDHGKAGMESARRFECLTQMGPS